MRSIYRAGGMLASNPGKDHKMFYVGEKIQFYPQIVIDQYKAVETVEPYLRHVIYDVFEFSFTPVNKYFNNVNDDSYHYLIEIFPNLILFCFNWTKPCKSYLQVGQRYEGYGQLSNCGDASEENRFIPSSAMRSIYRSGIVRGITENLLMKDYSRDIAPTRKQFRYGNGVSCYEDALEWYGYFRDVEEFRTRTLIYREKSIQYNGTDELSQTSSIVFCVDM